MAGSMVGRVLNDRYEITERVGIGGMAEVYRAQDKVLGRMVAVKVMLPQYAADETFTKRFRLEAASAARLQSPYIVSIYDWGLDGETYYIVMEFLRGTDLKTAIQERGAVNQRKVAEIGSQVAQALSVAHAASIIHRDIKPQNIMIQPDGNIKVMDFGIARAGDAGLSQTSTVLGTAHYVSPEQAQGKELGAASDIYSLGIVMYEAVTGKLPFEGQDAVSVAVKQVNEIPAPPSSINPNIDPTLELIIMKALEKDPSNRFTDASEMRHALNDYLAGRPVNIGDVSSMPTTVMGAAAGASTTVMPRSAAVATPGATTAMPAQQGRGANPAAANYSATDESSKPKGNRNKIIAGVVAVIAIIAIAAGVFALMNSGAEMVDVPKVAGETTQQATADLQAAGFVVGETTEVFNSEVEEGKVVSTDPEGGMKAEKGSTVSLTVSKGTETVKVPSLLGKTAEEAQSALEAVGLNGEQGDDVYSDKYDEGQVAEQSVKSGNKANKGDTITFKVSKGSNQVDIPNVVGFTRSAAESAIEDAGFRYDTTYSYSDSVSEGNVISQNKTGKAKEGTTIRIVVSQGKKPEENVSIPSVVGMSESSAESALENAGFLYDAKYQTVSDSSKDGVVIKQNKSGTAKKGSTITITIGIGPDDDSSDDDSSSSGSDSSSSSNSSSSTKKSTN
ncbi:MAG: Stk1 family PASTA domain-containing Ser/Thr kinase [Coriobacteriia bacterium]|nr:Stk1 family PASTA domain-containing Ser/Thr kinase [Coriobacteriia bacterium]